MEARMTTTPVPGSLKIWFVIHFVLDLALAIPLYFFPQAFLELFNWPLVDPLATRIVAAALFGIGIESWLGRNAAAETYKNMLNLKIIWSAAAVLGILLSILQNAQYMLPIVWLLLGVFFVFNLLWIYYRLWIGRLLAA